MALVRNPQSEVAAELAKLPHVTIVKGDLDDEKSIDSALVRWCLLGKECIAITCRLERTAPYWSPTPGNTSSSIAKRRLSLLPNALELKQSFEFPPMLG